MAHGMKAAGNSFAAKAHANIPKLTVFSNVKPHFRHITWAAANGGVTNEGLSL